MGDEPEIPGRLEHASTPPADPSSLSADVRLRVEVVEKPKAPSPKLETFLRHPVTMLVAGFLLTGVLGSWLTARWKASEWKYQQVYLQKQLELKEKYDLLSDTVAAVSETLVAASDVITIVYSEWNIEERAAEIEDRQNLWIAASREWRKKSRVIQFQLASYFGDPEADAVFQTIINKRRQLGVKTRGLLEMIVDAEDGSLVEESRAEAEAEDINALINTVSDELIRLGSMLGKHLKD